MIRIPTANGWRLIQHADHARLAGAFAIRWGNDRFARPEPFAPIHAAVARHDDAWREPDRRPQISPDGSPAAFSSELVGTYAAFEAIDLEAYLEVRGRATEVLAEEDPYAAVLVSMHTVNLLTEQADLSTLDPTGTRLHGNFIAAQRLRQAQLRRAAKTDSRLRPFVEDEVLMRAFHFLQGCDSFSLTACVRFENPIDLRHRHPTASGSAETIRCEPLGEDAYRLTPYPLDAPEVVFEVPFRSVGGRSFASAAELQAAYAAAGPETLTVTVIA